MYGSVKFLEDQWFEGTSLGIDLWELYIIGNEQTKTICEVLDERVFDGT
jgi:hypothetical protein